MGSSEPGAASRVPSEPRNWELAFESRTGSVSWELRAGEYREPGIKRRELAGKCLTGVRKYMPPYTHVRASWVHACAVACVT